MAKTRALIRVPASTSNLGPGFDCLGVGLQLYNTVRVEKCGTPRIHHGMVAETAFAFFERAKFPQGQAFHFEAKIEGDIPVSRGLGSSVTVRLGLLMGLNELAQDFAPLSRAQILELLIELEGHPDNAVASFHGGFVVCSPQAALRDGPPSFTRVEVKPDLSFVALIPELRLSTEEARGILPHEIPLRQAVENVQRTARIAALFCLSDYGALRGLFVDHFHQPFRCGLIPGFDDILSAAQGAGALGGFLSGAGSTLMALAANDPEKVLQAMVEAAKKNGLPARGLILKADNGGAKILETDR